MLEPDQWDAVLSRVTGTVYRGTIGRAADDFGWCRILRSSFKNGFRQFGENQGTGTSESF